MSISSSDLIEFEKEVLRRFEAKQIAGPVHLSGGNERQLMRIFKNIARTDWVFSTYRNHYHALLHGIPPDKVMEQIVAGKSMNLSFPEHRFITSAIVGGCLPMAVGVAAGIKRLGGEDHVWCFVGDMAAHGGAFHEAQQYAVGHSLPVSFIIEDNGMSCDSPTDVCWGTDFSNLPDEYFYSYERTYPHVGTGKYISF